MLRILLIGSLKKKCACAVSSSFSSKGICRLNSASKTRLLPCNSSMMWQKMMMKVKIGNVVARGLKPRNLFLATHSKNETFGTKKIFKNEQKIVVSKQSIQQLYAWRRRNYKKAFEDEGSSSDKVKSPEFKSL